MAVIFPDVHGVRDPFLLCEDGVYYLYGSTTDDRDPQKSIWGCFVNDSGTLQGPWRKTEEPVYITPPYAIKQFWAPEVHRYRGAYYLFGTYYHEQRGRRACAILKSDSPRGPFVQIGDGPVTPEEWDCIDGTLYVDRDGQPWLVFVHEWVCTDDKIGRMDAAKLAPDLSRLISEPVELFRADAPAWTDKYVTDGCFLQDAPDGSLLMLWSNFDDVGYTVGLAHSADGRVDGEWVHEDTPFYQKGSINDWDGGHGMLFTDTDGQRYLSIHAPNIPKEGEKESPVFIPVVWRGNTLAYAD